MSRVGKKPVEMPKGVEITATAGTVKVKGPKGELAMSLNSQVEVKVADGKAVVGTRSAARTARILSGTTRALLANMVTGVTKGFERKLELVGVGYRAQAQGRKLNLTLGFSHPVAYPVPEGITVETPSQTEIIVKGMDRHVTASRSRTRARVCGSPMRRSCSRKPRRSKAVWLSALNGNPYEQVPGKIASFPQGTCPDPGTGCAPLVGSPYATSHLRAGHCPGWRHRSGGSVYRAGFRA